MIRTYRVGGMTCEGCVRAVTRAIKREAPGAEVAIDLGGGLLKVTGEADAPNRLKSVGGTSIICRLRRSTSP